MSCPAGRLRGSHLARCLPSPEPSLASCLGFGDEPINSGWALGAGCGGLEGWFSVSWDPYPVPFESPLGLPKPRFPLHRLTLQRAFHQGAPTVFFVPLPTKSLPCVCG